MIEKFTQSLDDEIYNTLKVKAKERDITVQQLLRAVIIPWYIRENGLNYKPLTSTSIYEKMNQSKDISINEPVTNPNIQQYETNDGVLKNPSNVNSKNVHEETLLVNLYKLFSEKEPKGHRKHYQKTQELEAISPASYSARIKENNSIARKDPVFQEFSKKVTGNYEVPEDNQK